MYICVCAYVCVFIKLSLSKYMMYAIFIKSSLCGFMSIYYILKKSKISIRKSYLQLKNIFMKKLFENV